MDVRWVERSYASPKGCKRWPAYWKLEVDDEIERLRARIAALEAMIPKCASCGKLIDVAGDEGVELETRNVWACSYECWDKRALRGKEE